jgi:hypothetical protein
MFALAYLANWQRYRSMKWYKVLAKSVFDTALAGLLAAYYPGLLVTLSIIWVFDRAAEVIKINGIWRTVGSFLAGTYLSALASVALEGVLGVGVAAMDLISGSWIKWWRKTSELA